MSKGQKKKITVKVLPGEAVFVASVEVLDHIYQTYMYMAGESTNEEEAQSWANVAEQVLDWSNKTYYSGGETNEEEW